LLWELLAGRPPYPAGDPLAKLAAHQKRDIPDVRGIAPDTPERLSQAVRAFTRRRPEDRPQSIREMCERLGAPRRSGRKRLRRFKAGFNTAVPRLPHAAGAGGGFAMTAAMLFVLSGLSLTLLDEGARSQFLRLAQPAMNELRGTLARQPANSDRSDVAADANNRDSAANPPGLEPFPGPNAQGVIELATAGPFTSAEINAVGPLMIRGTAAVRPVIIIDEGPLRVTATRLTLDNVELRGRTGNVDTLLRVRVQQLNLRRCAFHVASDAGVAQSRQHDSEAIRWDLLDHADRRSGVVLEDCVFAGGGTALRAGAVPALARATNCLKLGRGALLSAEVAGRTARDAQFDIAQATLRGASALLEISLVGERPVLGQIAIVASDCLFELDGENAALVRLASNDSAAMLAGIITLRGKGSLGSPGLRVATLTTPNQPDPIELDDTWVHLEGLAVGEFQFAGPPSSDPRQSEVLSFQGPRLSMNPPGIDAKRLAPAPPQ
jgi:hypothetical protein